LASAVLMASSTDWGTAARKVRTCGTGSLSRFATIACALDPV
jgi:hypothetical protein